MSDEDSRKRSPMVTVLAIVGGIIALLGCGGMGLGLVVVVVLAQIGSNLATAFEEVSTEVGHQSQP